MVTVGIVRIFALIELQGEEELKSVEGRSDFYQLLISTTMYGDLSNIQIVRSDYKATIMKRIVHNNTIALKQSLQKS